MGHFMLPELGQIGSITLRTYTILLTLAVISGLVTLLWYGNHSDGRPSRWVDAGVGGVILGLVAGRLGHVALYWHYFQARDDEIWHVWRGGINWHFAVVGGVIGLLTVAKLRGVKPRELLDIVAMVLPVGTILMYTGCLASGCSYGAPVAQPTDYPIWLVAELPDLFGVVALRFASQAYGIALGILLLLIAIVMTKAIKRPGLRLWVLIILLGLGVFGIGFTRGDATILVGPLRIDQLLDLGIVVFGLLGLTVAIYRLPLYFEELLPDLREPIRENSYRPRTNRDDSR